MAAHHFHRPLRVLATDIPQPLVAGRNEPSGGRRGAGNRTASGFSAGLLQRHPYLGPRSAVAPAYPSFDDSRWSDRQAHLEESAVLRPECDGDVALPDNRIAASGILAAGDAGPAVTGTSFWTGTTGGSGMCGYRR